MALLLKNLRCIDPSVGLDAVCDIVIRDGKIIEVGEGLAISRGETRDLLGKIAVPGLVDMHVHLRDPGLEYKEDIASGARAAARGGFTTVCAMPNSVPVCDSGSKVSYVLEKAARLAKTRVCVAGALSKNLGGETLAEMGDMVAAGAVAFTDDGRGVQNDGMMRRAMDYAKQFEKTVLSHCQRESLTGGGVVNEGVVSTRLGLAGWPAQAEEIQIARDIALCALTGCALHIQHMTTAAGAALVRDAKLQGLPVTCEVTPHHLFLSEDDLDTTYDTNLKMNPPLRTAQDCLALQRALVDGTIDCIATDHAPHAAHEKALEFEFAPFGTTGLETALSLVLTHLVSATETATATDTTSAKDAAGTTDTVDAAGVSGATGTADVPAAAGAAQLDYQQLVERMAHAPRRILGLEPVQLAAGSTADVTIIDPTVNWTVGSDGWQSKAHNSAFIGKELKGRASDVYVGGYASMQDGVVL